jgi:hypothetical protein
VTALTAKTSSEQKILGYYHIVGIYDIPDKFGWQKFNSMNRGAGEKGFGRQGGSGPFRVIETTVPATQSSQPATLEFTHVSMSQTLRDRLKTLGLEALS